MNDVDTMPRLCGNEPVFMTQHAPAKVGRDDVCASYKQVFDAMNELFVFRREKDDWRVHRYLS